MEIQKSGSNSFSTKHPILNMILGCLLLLILVGIGSIAIYWLVKYIGIGITKAVGWLEHITSSLDAVIIVALITGTVSIIGVVFTSVIAKIIEYKQKRYEYLSQKREVPYAEFIDMVYKMQEYNKKGMVYPEEEMLNDMYGFSRKLTLWGLNRVIKNWNKFRAASSNNITGINLLFLMEDIMFAMRRDMGLRGNKRGNLLSFFVNDIKKGIRHRKK